MTKNEIVGRLKAGGLDASSTNRSAAVYVTEARSGRSEPGWFGFRIICDSEATERRVRSILSRWYDIDASGNVWRLRSRNRVPLMAIKRGGVPPTPPTPTGDYMYFEAQEANSTVLMTSTLETAPNFEYSTDGVTWQEWQHTTSDGTHTFDTLTLTEVGDRVYLRGDNPNGLGAFHEGAEMPLFSHFEMTGKIAAGGNITSLLDKDTEITEIPAYGFALLFGSVEEESINNSLTAAAAMPNVTTIGDGGCARMYSGCTSLTAAAAMPNVTTIGDNGCGFMYQGCTSLAAAANMPQLTTIGDNGCGFMYQGCTSLTAAANMPNVTTIGDNGCAGMYTGCTSLTAAAAMPNVTTIGEFGCSYMYAECTSLTAAANMPNVTTIGDNGCGYMYAECTSLTAAAAMPNVTTIGDGGCVYMYTSCHFNMSDDGTTLNFDFPTPPITAGESTYSTAYDVAQWMDNTNGFTNP